VTSDYRAIGRKVGRVMW